MQLEVEYVDIDSIKPYERNAKEHPQSQIEQIKRSIIDYQMCDPIGVWHGEVVEGHGRLMACKELGMDKVPVIRLDHLTDDQRREYMLVHNKTTMNSDFDMELLDLELTELPDFDAELYDFALDLGGDDYEEDDGRRSHLHHNVFENQEHRQFYSDNYYGIPVLRATQTYGDKFLRFCDWKEVDNYGDYIAHFFYDDYKFISAWREPEKYLDRLRQFKAVVAPDFSLYTDFPRALQILSCYRRNWCGAFWAENGIDVIPDVIWGDEKSYNYCFEGLPKHSVVAVSSVGVKRDQEWNGSQGDMFKAGYDEMMRRLEPTKVLFYGDMIDGLEGDIIQIPSFYAERREMLNEKKGNRHGPRQ